MRSCAGACACACACACSGACAGAGSRAGAGAGAGAGSGSGGYLEGLYECPEEDPDGVSLPQQLDQSGGPEQTEEAHVEEVFLERRFLKSVGNTVCKLNKNVW